MIKIWVIYHQPTDYSDANYVMREHHITRAKGRTTEVRPTLKVSTAATIEELRHTIPHGKQRVLRTPGDEPQIVEWWF